jgi:pimeloyl-ACP methyl ester carboxylesterase
MIARRYGSRITGPGAALCLCAALQSRCRLTFLSTFLLLWLSGCATTGSCAGGPALPASAHGIVFAADGAGDFRACSRSLRKAVEAEHLPFAVEAVPWSHGYGRVLSDQMGHGHARVAGQQLAERISELRYQNPHAEIFLVGHSAGSAVVLSAAELLPPDTVSKIILLAPSVSAAYDLRPALRCARGGMDVFYSKWDWWYLGFAVTLVGDADGTWLQPAAGRVGFRPRSELDQDDSFYAKLRQYPWDAKQAWTGNLGGHYGAYQQDFLKAYVLPLFKGSGARGQEARVRSQ